MLAAGRPELTSNATIDTFEVQVRRPPSPLDRVVDAASRGPESFMRLASLLPRITTLLDSAELLLTRVDALITRLELCETRVQTVIENVSSSERAAREVITAAAQIEQRARSLLDSSEPAVTKALKTVSYAGDRFGSDQVDAVVAYLDFLPLLQALDREVVPMIGTMQTVAPDLTELLAVSRALNELMGSLPGLGRAKKRIDEDLARETGDGDG